MPPLKPHQHDLLVRIVESGGLPTPEVDGRLLRPLRTAGLAKVEGERVIPTRAGRSKVGDAAGSTPDPARLNRRQEDLLRTIARRGEVPVAEVDGRVTRPLLARGLVAPTDADVLCVTRAGEVYLESRPAPARRGRKSAAEHGRAAAIRRAVRQLEASVPRGSEVLVGNIMASADDVMDGFLRHARALERAPSGCEGKTACSRELGGR